MCLVHEQQDCIIDLVRNLKYSDPKSTILLYNGGTDKTLFDHFPFERYGVIIHPDPKPLKWGWLHDFAIDCMDYAIKNLEFDTITVVDSDQLACGVNFTDFITQIFYDNPNLGMLGQIPSQISCDTTIHPAITAYEEKDLWQPFLDQLPNGKEAFLHWTFWPSTTFTYLAAAALTKLFRTNVQLQDILGKTKIWASEEIILPTLTVALGFSILENPCSYDFVRYKSVYYNEDIQKALEQKKTFWIHPVARDIKDKNRVSVRKYFQNYIPSKNESSEDISQLIKSIYPKIENIEGWLEDDEFELLVTLAYQKAISKKNRVFLEIGSYCGKATSVISLVNKFVNNGLKVIAIDDFTGRLGAEDGRIDQYPPCYEKFRNNLENLHLLDEVEVVSQIAYLVDIKEKIDFLLIDGLHDYANVARDFYHFEKNLNEDAIVLFHDHNFYFPGVLSFVQELIHNNSYQIVNYSSSLIALQKRIISNLFPKKIDFSANLKPKESEELSLVSCIMPTYNRPEFIKYAVEQFLSQTYPNKELIIIDDSDNSIESLIPNNSRIKYLHLNEKLDLGSKRNLACKKSQGKYIIHLDDDDFYAPNWIEKQIAFLVRHKLEITGLSTPLFYDKSTSDIWQYTYPEDHKAWVYGATLCYMKKIWESNPFPVMNCGEDNAFVWGKNIKSLMPNNIIDSYLGQIHDKNTSPKQTGSERWDKVKKEYVNNFFSNSFIESISIFSDLKV